jgi:general secretion pathway protein A
MYAGHFGFSARPFVHGPAGRFCVANPGVAEATARLAATLSARDQVAVVTGGPGVGKSALVERAIGLAGDVDVVRADLRATDPDELLRAVVAPAGLAAGTPLPEAVVAGFARRGAPGRAMTLVVDVGTVNAELARRLLRVAHLAGDAGAGLNLVLQGPHTLFQLLDAPALIHLRQRVACRHRVRPMALLETAAYIRELLGHVVADVDGCLAANVPAVVQLYVAGVPRLVNTLMDASLAEAAARGLARLEPEVVKAVAEQLGWKPIASPATAPAVAAAGKPVARPRAPEPAPRARPAEPPVTATLPASEMTSRLLAAAAVEAARLPKASTPVSLAAPDKPVRKLADLGTASSPSVPPLDPVDPGATGMLRLEDLDDRFAESLFGGESGGATAR